jgi:hypothetical protein
MQSANVLSSRSIRAAAPRVAPRRQTALLSPYVCRGVQFNQEFMGEYREHRNPPHQYVLSPPDKPAAVSEGQFVTFSLPLFIFALQISCRRAWSAKSRGWVLQLLLHTCHAKLPQSTHSTPLEPSLRKHIDTFVVFAFRRLQTRSGCQACTCMRQLRMNQQRAQAT